jgi:hypothetical protein
MTTEEVARQLQALGLAAFDGEELEEITHRINAINEAVRALDHESLDSPQPFAPADQEQQP